MSILLMLGCSRPPAEPSTGTAAGASGEGAIHLVRLTHRQWENSVVDLLHLPGPTGQSDEFVPDAATGTFEDDATALYVSPTLWQQYQSAAEAVAAQLLTDRGAYVATVPSDPRPGGTSSDWVATDQQLGAIGPGETVRRTWSVPDDGLYVATAHVTYWSAARLRIAIDGLERWDDAPEAPVTTSVDLTLGARLDAGPHTVEVSADPDDGEADAELDSITLAAVDDALGPSTAGDAERDEWLPVFLRRAFRRDATAGEVATYRALFDGGADVFRSGDPFADGVHAVVAGALQSPSFLYRAQGLAGDDPELEGYELAAKLSYALWNTTPDDELLDVARDGLTPDELADQADRLLADPRAHATLADLHRQLLHVDNYQNIYRSDEEVFADFSLSTPAAMQDELYVDLDELVFGGGAVRDLFTTRRTWVDYRLAAIYELPDVTDTELVPVQLDPKQRSGLLTLSGFLSWQADKTEENLIGRGGFVASQLLCIDLPSPPPGVPPLPPLEDGDDRTLRQRIEDHTSVCGAGCHTDLINPLGFAFAGYDQTGMVQREDNGQPVDMTGTYDFDDGTFSYDGAVELSEILAERPQVHRCYAERLLSYLEGRPATPADDPRLDELEQRSLDEDAPILDLVRDLVTSDAFRRDP